MNESLRRKGETVPLWFLVREITTLPSKRGRVPQKRKRWKEDEG